MALVDAHVDGVVSSDVLVGGGEMGRLMRAHPWSSLPIGPLETWPRSLQSGVNVCLSSPLPMIVFWGPHCTQFYNDACLAVLADKHPMALGQPARECWPDLWDSIGPLLASVLVTGEAMQSDDVMLLLHRDNDLQEGYFTFLFSPIRDESGGVGGVFCAVTETTRWVVSERRLRTLRDLAAHTAEATSALDACARAAQTLALSPHDLPGALLYLLDLDGQHAHLAGLCGLALGTPLSPSLLDLTAMDDPSALWPVHTVMTTGRPILVELRSPIPVPAGLPMPRAALVLPVFQPGHDRLAGFLIAVLSPTRVFDDAYQDFLSLAAGQLATAIAAASARDESRALAAAMADLDDARTLSFSGEPEATTLAPPACILVADANPAMRDYMVRLLSPTYSVRAVGDGRAALGEIEHWRPDVVLADITMPELDGLALLHTLRARPAPHGHPYVILLSARTGADAAIEGLRAGAADYLVKPFAAHELLARVHSLVEMTRLRARAADERVQLLAAAEETLRSLERNRDAFLSSTVHDLKNPLATIRGLAQLAQRRLARPGPVDPASVVDLLMKIEAGTTRMMSVIGELMDLTRGNMNVALILDRRPVDLVSLVRGVMSQHDDVTSHHFSLLTSCTQLISSVDSPRVERIIANLLNNAMKYSPHGSQITIRIAQEDSAAGARAVIAVEDQGMGIPVPDLPTIFELFRRASNVATLQGSGIGLASARQITAQHGGTIEVESEEGRGSTFTVRLPLLDAGAQR